MKNKQGECMNNFKEISKILNNKFKLLFIIAKLYKRIENIYTFF